MRPRRLLAPALAALLLAAGCGTYEVPIGQESRPVVEDAAGSIPDDVISDRPDVHPDALVGRWVEEGEGYVGFLDLHASGDVQLDDGCRIFPGGRWRADRGLVTLDLPRARPSVACVAEVVPWPGQLASLRLDGERLVGLDGEGEELVELVKDEDDVIRYRITGGWDVRDELGDPSVRFDPDGSIVGFDGCNGFSGERAVPTGQGVRFEGSRMSTLVGCYDGRGAWLTDVVGYRLDGPDLAAVDLDGATVATLRRAPAEDPD